MDVDFKAIRKDIDSDNKKFTKDSERTAKELADKAFARKLQLLEDEKSLIQVRLNNARAGSAEELKIEIEKINQETKIAEAQKDVTRAKRKEIESNAAKEIYELREKILRFEFSAFWNFLLRIFLLTS